MVDLMLYEGRPDAFKLGFLFLPLRIDIAHARLRWALDLGGEVRDGEATLLVHAHLLRALEDLGIDHDNGRLRRLVLGGVHDDEPPQYAELRRSKPDAGRLVHGGKHVVHEPTQFGIHPLDGFWLLAQDGIGRWADW